MTPAPAALPSVAPSVEITFAGEKRILKYGFRAYKALDLNPFDRQSIQAFQDRALALDVAALIIQAGLLHEYYGKGATRKGETPPTIEEVMDELDMFVFTELLPSIQKAMGTDREDPKPMSATEEQKEPDPPSA